MQENMKEYFSEKEARERRLAIYTEKIQETVLNKSAETIRSLVDVTARVRPQCGQPSVNLGAY